MFKPSERSDRKNYCKLLSCPDGFNLDFAVGTTYSLDLETLTAMCFSLGIDNEPSETLLNNPVILLNAFQKVSDKILIFNEPGQIKVPNKVTQLDFLLEKMVVPVMLEKLQNSYPAFHPKIWILKYSNLFGESLYRLIVLSRNLTFDRSWDIAFSIDGKICEEDEESNSQNIVFFLEFLKEHLPSNLKGYQTKNTLLKNLCSELKNVRFETESKDFDNFEFLPLGIGQHTFPIFEERVFNEYKNFESLVIVSPFLSNEIMEKFNRDSRNSKKHTRTLITRDFSLSKISRNNLTNFDVYTIKDDVFEGETVISEDIEQNGGNQNQDIHAKMYFMDYKKEHTIYFGSANATRNGFSKNVEVLVRLNSAKPVCNRIKSDLNLGDDKSPFQKINVDELDELTTDDEKAICDKLEALIKDVCHKKLFANVIQTADEKFNIEISIDLEDDFDCSNIELKFFNSERKQNLSKNMTFENLELNELSEFYVLIAKGDKEISIERIIKIPTAPIPEEREKNIIKNIINSRESFYEYISFVLSDDYILTNLTNQNKLMQGLDFSKTESLPAVYEGLLKSSLVDKKRLSDLKYIMDTIDDSNVIPKDFRKIYSVFINALEEKNE